MTLEKKLQLLMIAKVAIQEMAKMSDKTEEECFIVDASKQIYVLLDEILTVYNKIVNDTSSNIFKTIIQSCLTTNFNYIVESVKDTETQDAIIGVGSAILHNQTVQAEHIANSVSEQLAHQQINEFNEMMNSMDF